MTRYEAAAPRGAGRREAREVARAAALLLAFGAPAALAERGLTAQAMRTSEAVVLDAGLKVTGREGRTSFGVLAVAQGEGAALPAQNLFVGRGVVNVLEQSSLGVIATHGDPLGGENSVYGTDFRYTQRERVLYPSVVAS